jgi:uncharacterized membrane protein
MNAALAVAVPSFLASLVEFVEALTIVIAVGSTRGWRSAGLGTFIGAAVLTIAILVLGPALSHIPIGSLQLAVGIALLFFGMRWLRKAVLRYAGAIAFHDESQIFAKQAARLASDGPSDGYDWGATGTAFNAVVLEGLEVVFIVIALGSTAGALVAASAGAAAAGVVVVFAGFALRAPLARVPENLLKFGVGIMLSAFGTFWTGEGIGVAWPGKDTALLWLASAFLAIALCGIALGRRIATAR